MIQIVVWRIRLCGPSENQKRLAVGKADDRRNPAVKFGSEAYSARDPTLYNYHSCDNSGEGRLSE
jgi:hypothetical protein